MTYEACVLILRVTHSPGVHQLFEFEELRRFDDKRRELKEALTRTNPPPQIKAEFMPIKEWWAIR